jgi:hypothetical protein
MADISTTQKLTQIPVKATKPIPNGRENELSVISSPTITNGSAMITE